jgi:3-deoxy-manno-octulosonate cytidylyltransferase (CMP-KDO synthetase)
MSNYTIIIPCRLHSTRLPQKALLDLGGKPLMVQVSLQAQKTGQHVIMAVDDSLAVDVCKKYDLDYCLTSTEHISGTDRLAEVVQQRNFTDDSIVVNVQGDEPFMPIALIDDVAQALLSQPDCYVATAAHLINTVHEVTNPNVVKVVLDKYSKALYFSRASIPWQRNAWQAADQSALYANTEKALGTMLRHIGIYAYRTSFLKQYTQLSLSPIEQIEMLEQLRILYHGISMHVCVTNSVPHTGIDTQEDLDAAKKFFLI